MTTINMTRHRSIPVAGRLFGSKPLHVPADLMVVCLWAIIGLTVTALIGAFDAGADLASILAAAE